MLSSQTDRTGAGYVGSQIARQRPHTDRIFGNAALWLRSSPFVAALLALGFATGFIVEILDSETGKVDVTVDARKLGDLSSKISMVSKLCNFLLAQLCLQHKYGRGEPQLN